MTKFWCKLRTIETVYIQMKKKTRRSWKKYKDKLTIAIIDSELG